MELPEELKGLVDRMGEAIVQAVAGDARCRELAARIQEQGWEMAMVVEATLALHRRGEDAEAPAEAAPSDQADAPEPERPGAAWSAEDRAWLQRFKIRLD